MTEESLFEEFQKVSAKAWKQKIQYDLKGKDYNETLVWESLEGIKVKPFYHEEDLTELPQFELSENDQWRIAQEIIVADEKTANQKALHAMQKGAESLIFTLQNPMISWDVLFLKIALESISVHLVFEFLDVDCVKSLEQYLQGKEKNIHLHIDSLGNLCRTGNWFFDEKEDHRVLKEIRSLCATQSGISVFSVDTALYQNAGATCIQQLAYALAHGHEYLSHFDSTSASTGQSFPMTFKIAIGGNYFFEIAKFRAMRLLWKSLAEEYQMEDGCHILATPSKRNKTVYDYNVNQLRTTMECMAAVLGGADTLSNFPYDGLYKESNEFSERIARNQLLVLKNESYFDEVTGAANGSYYIEHLTQQLAGKALELFKQIEKGGGFLAQLKEGTIQRKIKESAKKEQDLFDAGALHLVGTNKYTNLEERMLDELERQPFPKSIKRKTQIEPIMEIRLAASLEKKRLDGE